MEMIANRWWSQPFPPEGGVTGSGVMRQLGSPSMEMLDVLVRESAQNSWDASLGGQVHYSIDFRRLGGDAHAWREIVGDVDGSNLTVVAPESLNSETLILIVSDRGTAGLGGPLLANEKVKKGTAANFVQFLRNVGEPRDKELGGGTYGFGKAIFYGLSECGAIVVDSNCTDRTNQRRLMGAALGDPFTSSEGVRYTGRHWWGIADGSSGVALPLLGESAANVSRRLGLPGFAEGTTGTDIAIIMPNLKFGEFDDSCGSSDLEAACERVVSAILWHLWPKLGSSTRDPELTVTVTREGIDVPVLRPDKYPFLRPFVQALDAVEKGESNRIVRKGIAFPGEVGSWSMHICQPDPSAGSSEGLLSAKPFSGNYHHVARMRQARLIVDYLECEPFPGHQFGYASAFLAASEFDQCFADAEPPTHDKWEARGLPDKQRLVVNYATNKVREGIKRLLADQGSSRSSDLAGLGRLSANLAPLIPFDGRSVGSLTPKRKRTSAPERKGSPIARVLEQPRLVRENGIVRLVTVIRPPAVAHQRLKITVEPYVLLDDGRREKDPPRNAPVPMVIGWTDENGAHLGYGPDLLVTGEVSALERLIVELSIVPDTAIGVLVRTEEA